MANAETRWSVFDVLAMEAVNLCWPDGPRDVTAAAVVSDVENTPPLRTTVPVGQVAVAEVLEWGGLSAVENATL